LINLYFLFLFQTLYNPPPLFSQALVEYVKSQPGKKIALGQDGWGRFMQGVLSLI